MLTSKTCTQSLQEAQSHWVTTAPLATTATDSHASWLRAQKECRVATSCWRRSCQEIGVRCHRTKLLTLPSPTFRVFTVLAACQLLFANSFASWFHSLVCNFAVSTIWPPHAFLFFQWDIVQRPRPVFSVASSSNHARDLRGAHHGFLVELTGLGLLTCVPAHLRMLWVGSRWTARCLILVFCKLWCSCEIQLKTECGGWRHIPALGHCGTLHGESFVSSTNRKSSSWLQGGFKDQGPRAQAEPGSPSLAHSLNVCDHPSSVNYLTGSRVCF